MDFKLREYQDAMVSCVLIDWQHHRSVLATMATGAGKTICFLETLRRAQQPGQRSLILAHRQELIHQPIDKMRQFFPHMAERTGIVMNVNDQTDQPITVACVPSLQNGRLDALLEHGAIDYVITDECFVAGTPVDGKPIEQYEVGDKVTAWNEVNGQLEQSIVTHVFKSLAPETLYRITVGEQSIVCTGNHPILCNGDWTEAKYVNEGDYLVLQNSAEEVCGVRDGLHAKELEQHNDTDLFGTMQKTSQRSTAQGCDHGLCSVWENCGVQGAENAGLGAQGSSILFGAMQRCLVVTKEFPHHGSHQSEICQSENVRKQPNAESRIQRENAQNHQGVVKKWIPGWPAWGQWYRGNSPASDTGRGIGLAYGGGYPHWSQRQRGIWLSFSLQGGHWQRKIKDCHRGGREQPQSEEKASAGSQKGSTLGVARVDSVEILESGSDGRYEEVCPDGYVYNLEVANYHTYLANGIIVHNCHHSVAQSYQNIYDRVFDHNPQAKHLGVTATPMRGDGMGLGSIFEKESIHIDLAQLVKLGYLAPPRWLGIKVGVKLDNSQKSGTGANRDFTKSHLRQVFETDNVFDLIVATHKKFAGDRQGMVFCVTVEGAHDLAAKFNDAGITAAAVDGTTPDDERKQIIDDYLSGDITMLCNFGIFTEGTDLPPLSVIHMARPTSNDALYLQCIGRGARLYPGKEDFLVLDYAPTNSRNIRMLGDILKVSELKDLNRDAYIDDDVDEGEVIGGFTYDGRVSWMEGDPMEIVGRQLDYLNQSPFKWTQPNKRDWMVLGLGEGEDGNQRILAISPASHEGMALWGITKTKGQWHHRARRLEVGDFETLSTRGEQIAMKWGAPVLFGKKKPWMAKPPSEKMVKFAKKMGVYDPTLNAGQISEALNYKLATDALKRAGAIER